MKLAILVCIASSALASFQCGIPLPNPIGVGFGRHARSIIGGNTVTKGKWPWQISLQKVENGAESLICGGTVISDRWILTAAHCINPSLNRSYTVRGGYSRPDETHSSEPFPSTPLRETILPIVRQDICKTDPNIMEDFELICAGSMGHSASNGDSGGPLMMKADDGRWFQIGIASFADDMDKSASVRPEKLIPTAFTDVRKYCGWINLATEGDVKCQEETVTMQDVEIHV